MSAVRHQATWRSIVFNRRYLDAGLAVDDPANIDHAHTHNDYRIKSFNASSLTVADLHEARQFLEGSEPNQAYEGSRILEVRGEIIAPTHADLEDMTWALDEAFSPAACRAAFVNNDPPHVGPFQFKRDTSGGSLALRAYCRPAMGRPLVLAARGEGTAREFLARLMAYDPKFYAESLTSTPLANLTGGNNTVTNAGVLATDPKFVIVLSGNGSAAFTITNTTTGHAMVFDLSAIGAGTYTLDVYRALFTKSDGSNKLAKRVSGFPVNMWLAAGANTITVTGNTNLTSVTAQFRAAYA